MKVVPFGLLGVVATLVLSSPLLACNHPHCKCHKAKVTTVTTTTTTRVPVTGQFVTQAAPLLVSQAAPLTVPQSAPLVVTQAAAAQTYTLQAVTAQAVPQTFTIQAAPQLVTPQAGLLDFLNPITPFINPALDATQVAQLRAIRGDLATLKADVAAIKTSVANIEASSAAIRDHLTGKKATTDGKGNKEPTETVIETPLAVPNAAVPGSQDALLLEILKELKELNKKK